MARAQTALAVPERWDAEFSPDGLYRYALWRTWDALQPAAVFIGLNPSTADETADDNTIRRCKRFARDWGYGGLVMVNLFAFCSTDPKLLEQVDVDPVGPENDDHLRVHAEQAGIVVAAWGAFRQARDRAAEVVVLLGPDLHCLGTTADGAPRHPLFVRADTLPARWPA